MVSLWILWIYPRVSVAAEEENSVEPRAWPFYDGLAND